VTQDILCGPGIRDTMVTPYPLLRSKWLNAVPTKPVPPPEKQWNRLCCQWFLV